MKAFFVALGTALYERVWMSYKSTILGIAVACVGEALNYTLNAVPDPKIHALCALLTTIFFAWKDKKVKEGSIKLLAIAFLFYSFSASAAGGTPSARIEQAAVKGGEEVAATPPLPRGTLADVATSDPVPEPTPAPKIGGCFSSGKLCIGPTFAISLAAINLSSKKVEGAFSPGVGIGLTWNPGSWTSIGFGAFLNLDPGAQNAGAAGIVSFLNGYLRVGFSKGFIGDVSARLLFGTGIDL